MTSFVLDEAGRQLAEDNVSLVEFVVRKYFGKSGADPEDLVSIGNIALCKAAATYNPNKGIRFCTYAAKSIVNEIIKEFVRMSRQKRGSGASTTSLDELIGVLADDAVDVAAQAIDKVILEDVIQYMPTLAEIELRNMSMTEYAMKNGMPISTVYTRVHREINRVKRKVMAGSTVA